MYKRQTDGNGGLGVIDTYFLVGTETPVEGSKTFGQTHTGSGVFSVGGYRFDLPELSSRAYVAAAREDGSKAALDAAALTQVQGAVASVGGTLAAAPQTVSLVERGTFMSTVTVRFGGVLEEPTAIVRVDDGAVTPVPAAWQRADGELTAVVQLTEDGILAPVKVAAKSFTDTKAGAWYLQVVNEAVQKLWMSGTSATTFDPEGLLDVYKRQVFTPCSLPSCW